MNTKITLLSKLKKNDSITGLDVWYKYFLENIAYKKTSVSDISGTTVSVGQTATILIPFSDKYRPYNEWKNLPVKEDFYTISVGDLIILNEFISDDVNPNTISKIRNNYNQYILEVKSITEVEQKYGVKYRLRIEGV